MILMDLLELMLLRKGVLCAGLGIKFICVFFSRSSITAGGPADIMYGLSVLSKVGVGSQAPDPGASYAFMQHAVRPTRGKSPAARGIVRRLSQGDASPDSGNRPPDHTL